MAPPSFCAIARVRFTRLRDRLRRALGTRPRVVLQRSLRRVLSSASPALARRPLLRRACWRRSALPLALEEVLQETCWQPSVACSPARVVAADPCLPRGLDVQARPLEEWPACNRQLVTLLFGSIGVSQVPGLVLSWADRVGPTAALVGFCRLFELPFGVAASHDHIARVSRLLVVACEATARDGLARDVIELARTGRIAEAEQLC